jgi:pyruvate, water dikinase
MNNQFIKLFTDIRLSDSLLVGGKNASLGEMIQSLSKHNIRIPLGFAVTCEAYLYHLRYNNLIIPIKQEMDKLTDYKNITLLQKIGESIRTIILTAPFPPDLIQAINHAYKDLCHYYNQTNIDVAIRSSATAEDLPHASFAGQQETYLHIQGQKQVLDAIKNCMASLFTDRAIVYRIEQNFDHFQVAISVGVQKMVRSDKASSGVLFTLETESGFKDLIVINSSYGLGENIVQGLVNPDEFHVHKPTLIQGYKPIIKKKLGSKESKLIYTNKPQASVKNVSVLRKDRIQFSLTDAEILELARQALIIENYYSELRQAWSPMDIEWAKDGIDNQLYILQARPETVHSSRSRADILTRYTLTQQHDSPLIAGLSIGRKIAHGMARICNTIQDITDFNEGDILVTPMTDPDWIPYMKKAAAIITDQGGRTCHAAIVSRELGIPALVGTLRATEIIPDGAEITVDCSNGAIGYVYLAKLPFTIEKTQLRELPQLKTDIMLNIGDPDQAYELSFLPISGVGLARLEFIINNTIKIHPMLAAQEDTITDHKLRKKVDLLAQAYNNWQDFYVTKLAEGMATIAAAFYPKPVIIRLSDFKTNEYRHLLGGSLFEPHEENPMLGFRGAIRYCSPAYAPAFDLECNAIRKVFFDMGLKNIKLMLPFVRTTQEAAHTLALLEKHGLSKQNGLSIFMMCELPANIILLEEFSHYFDGFSIGSNDLTQLTLGVDRDSGLLSSCFDERDPAVQKFLLEAVAKAHKIKKYIGICGQAPSDFPEIGRLLINAGINSISLNADSVIPFLLSFK